MKARSVQEGVEGSGPSSQPLFPSFSWGPDGDCVSFVKVAAIVVVCVSAVQLEWELPKWLCADLSEMQASFVFKGGQLNRCLSSLQETMFNSKQNRAADPFMVDHMLVQGGFTSNAHTDDFVSKYNAREKF